MHNDLPYAIRVLLKSPGFTAVAVVTLALGIGANTAIFSVVDTVLLRPLPYKDLGRIVKIWGTRVQKGVLYDDVSIPDLVDLREQNHVFEQIAADDFAAFITTRGADPPEFVGGAVITASWLPALGVKPILGRNFLPEEERPGHDQVVILTHAYWLRRFGADPTVIGRQLTLNHQAYTVVGILPPNVRRSGGVDIFKPLVEANYMADRGSRDMDAYARLKPGVSLHQAQAEMDVIARRLEQRYPTTNKDYGFRVEPLLQAYSQSLLEPSRRKAQQDLWLILAAVGLVLLIACGNVASLLLARAVVRQKEFTIRTALGSSRARLIRQLLTESSLLFLCGGMLGVVLADWSLPLLVNLAVTGGYALPGTEVALNSRILVVSLLLSLLTGILFGLTPAFQASRINLNDALKDSSKTMAGRFRRNGLQSSLVISELALALVLLVGFGLLIRSLFHVEAVRPGFDPEDALTTITSKEGTEAEQVTFWKAVLEHGRTLPGVRSTVLTSRLPLIHAHGKSFAIEGRPAAQQGEQPLAKDISVSPDFFNVMSIPISRGRSFTERDSETAAPVAIISESAARRYFPHQNPIGLHIKVEDSPLVQREIVGVVADVRQENLDEESPPTIYRPYCQIIEHDMFLVIRARSSSDLRNLARTLRTSLMKVDKALPWGEVQTLRQIIDGSESLSLRRFFLMLLGSFVALALILTAVGNYGVMAYFVSERTREIGIRIALGALPGAIFRQVLYETLRLALIGISLGVLLALVLTRFISSMLFGVSATDFATYGGVSLLLVGVALLACYIPARKATRVDPIVALRYE